MVKLLTAEGLVYAYDGVVRALAGVSLHLDPGELVAVIGPNGSGKSTLLRLLGGLLVPDAGSVELGGRPLGRLGPKDRARRIALVPQQLRALPDVTVADFVRSGRYAHLDLWRRPQPEDERAARRALAEADVGELGGRLLDQLSGGQRQRVLLARALAQEAELLLIDEPTNSLDPEHQILVFELVSRLTREGRAAVVVTHELNLASQFATRLLLLDEGRVAAEGGVDDVLRREVLQPVYGTHLAYGRLPAPVGAGDRPFVVPWLRSPESGPGDPPPS